MVRLVSHLQGTIRFHPKNRVGGFAYTDVLHIYGLSRAGYIPQLFSLRLPNPVVIYELLQGANAKALIYDATFESVLNDCPVPAHSAVYDSSGSSTEEPLPAISTVSGDETVFIFHTSGSTSGRPKLVPCSYAWLDTVVRKSEQICKPQNPNRQDVTVCMFVSRHTC